MGDMADDALDHMMDMDELQTRYGTFDSAVADGVEEQLYDYDGSRFPHVFGAGGARKPWSKPSGPGPCPKCSEPTVERKGPFGTFYGCSKFPKCNGNRDE